METLRLKQFCTIVETGSIAKAATLLHITSSGLSKSMKILQDELGKRFLRPVGRGLSITEEGTRFYKNAKALLEMEHQLFYATHKSKPHHLKIGTTESFIAALCQNINSELPHHTSISILDLTPGQIEQMVASRELDYGITYTPFPMEKVDVVEIGRYQLGCYHLEGQFSNMGISDIPFAVPAASIPTNPLGIKERDGWMEGIVPRYRQFLVNLLSTGIELTLQGLCAIYIPKYLAAHINNKRSGQPRLIEKSVPKALKTEQSAFLISHADKSNNKDLKRIKKLIRSTIKS